jgi:hypothetical protein
MGNQTKLLKFYHILRSIHKLFHIFSTKSVEKFPGKDILLQIHNQVDSWINFQQMIEESYGVENP